MKKNNKKTQLSFNKVFCDIREKIAKITYFKIKENPAIKQAEIMIQGEMKMGEKVIKEPKAKKVPDLHPELKKFIAEQNERWNNQFELNNEIKGFIKEQNQRWDQQFEFNHQQNKKWESQTELNNEIKEFIKDQNRRWDQQFEFNQQQNQKWKEQIEFNQQMQKTNQVVLTSIQDILLRLERIESLPTNKKELNDLK